MSTPHAKERNATTIPTVAPNETLNESLAAGAKSKNDTHSIAPAANASMTDSLPGRSILLCTPIKPPKTVARPASVVSMSAISMLVFFDLFVN